MVTDFKSDLIAKHEVEIIPIRARGPGGQHVNKSSSAIHLRFDIKASSLPQNVKDRLLELNDSRITNDGIIIIKSRDSRSQYKNKAEAYKRLMEIIQQGMTNRKKRISTKPSLASRIKRLQDKKLRGKLKRMRGKITSREY